MKYKIGDVFITTGQWARNFPGEKIKIISIEGDTYVCHWTYSDGGSSVDYATYRYFEPTLDEHILDEVTQVKRLLDEYAD